MKKLILFLLFLTGLIRLHAQQTNSLPGGEGTPCGGIIEPLIQSPGFTSVSSTVSNLNLGWANSGTGSQYTVKYKLVGSANWQQSCVTSSRSCTVNGLTRGSTYDVLIIAVRNCDEAGTPSQETSQSGRLVWVPLPAPASLSASAVTTSGFTATWGAVAGASSYRLDVATDPNFITGIILNNFNVISGTSKAVTVDELPQSTTYHFRVRAVSAGGTSTSSSNFSVTTPALPPPPVPVSLAASSVSSNSFVLLWQAGTGATTSSYRLDVSSPTGSVHSNFTVSTTSKTISGLAPGTTYSCKVRAVNASGISADSPTLSVTTSPLTPPAPANLAASSVSTTSFVISWSPSTGATSYRLDVATNDSFTTGIKYNNFTVSTTSQSVTGLTPGTTYYARVRAVNGSGTSPNSTVRSALLIPAAPTILAATGIAPTSFTANWQTTGTVEHSYVDVSIDTSFDSLVYTGLDAGASSLLNITGLGCVTTYYYRVRASNSGGTSLSSATSAGVFTPLCAPDMEPAGTIGPFSFVAHVSSFPEDTQYYFEASTTSTFTTHLNGYDGTFPVSSPSLLVIGLLPETVYYIRARVAHNSQPGVLSDFSPPLPVETIARQTESDSKNPFNVTIIPPSPEASALAKYADIPVTLYSGTPSISIPLSEIKEHGLTLPISLNYHGSGNKVESIAPRTGLGWTLSAGGVVTRVLRNMPDEHPKGFLNNLSRRYPNVDAILNLPNGPEKFILYESMANGCVDSEPDLFYFNFAGYSGQFMFDWDKQLKVVSGNSIKIEPFGLNLDPNNTVAHYIDSLKITVDDGTVFIFAAIETTQVIDIIGPTSCYRDDIRNDNMPQSWFLTEMRPANQNSWIRFEYDTYSQRNEIRNLEQKQYNNLYGERGTPGDAILKVVNHTKNLRKISVSSGQTVVDFLPSTDARTDVTGDLPNYALGQINVTNANGRQVKHWDLGYSYGTGRLTLETVTERAGEATKPPYEFIYNGSIPQPTSLERDHWGFKNNNTASTLIPKELVFPFGLPPVELAGADRSPSPTKVLDGMLTQIKYPTGGSDFLTFEPHDYSFEQNRELTREVTISQRVLANAPRSSAPTDDELTDSKPIVLTGATDLTLNISFEYHIQNFPGAGDTPGIKLKNSQGEIIWNLVMPEESMPQQNEEHSYTLPPFNIPNIPAGTYTIVANGAYQPNFGGTNNASVEVTWEEGTGIFETEIRQGGGVRIAEIKRSYGNGNPDNVTVYRYRENEGGTLKSSGSLLESGAKYSIPIEYVDGEAFGGAPIGDGLFIHPGFVRSSRNKTSLGTTGAGSHVGYSEVTVLQGENGENGKSVYHYTSPREIPDGVSDELPFPPGLSQDHLRGLLLDQTVFSAGSMDTLHCVENTYEPHELDIPAIVIGWKQPGQQSNMIDAYAVGPYANRFGYTRIKKTRERTMNANAPALETITTYEYNETTHKQLVSSTVTNSKGESIVTALKYPLDYSSPSAPINKLKDLHIDNVPVEKLVWKNETGSQVSLLSGLKTDFAINNNGVVPSIKYGAKISDPVLTSDPYGTVDSLSLYEPRLILSNPDIFDNPGEISVPDGMKTAYQWGHQGTLPVAKADNASPAQIFYESFEEGVSSPVSTAEQKTGRKAYVGGNFTIPFTPTPASAYVMSYWYYAGGQWLFSGVIPFSTAINTSATYLDEIRVHRKDAQMTTYTYEPLVGMTSVTDPNNVTTYYEYDVFGRLQFVRDQDRNIVQRYDYQFHVEVPFRVIEGQ